MPSLSQHAPPHHQQGQHHRQQHVQLRVSPVDAALVQSKMAAMLLLVTVGATHPAMTTTTAVQI